MTRQNVPADTEAEDAVPLATSFGKGGVPWYLLLFYLSFLVFFTWYVLEYQLPDYLEQGPGQGSAQGAADIRGVGTSTGDE